MRLTLIDERQIDVDADIDGDRVLISPAELEWATGWELKPEGLCKGPVCVVLHEPVESSDGRVDLGAVAHALGRAIAVSIDGGVAALAGDPMRYGQTGSIDELELPDLTGEVVRMSELGHAERGGPGGRSAPGPRSDFAGRKRLLIAWASW